MHRSRLSLLVILAGAGACSTRDASDGNKVLSQDSTLVAQLDADRNTQHLPLPDACGPMAIAAQPAVAKKSQAERLTKQAYNAEMLGNVKEARSLLLRASELDGTDKSAAYHLGRTNEALGDQAAAMTAYCRYLTLTKAESAESAEARQRVTQLSQTQTRVAAGSVSDSMATRQRAARPTTRRLARNSAAIEPRRVVSKATVEQPMRATSPEHGTNAASAVAGGTVELPTASDSVSTPPGGDGGGADRAAVGDDGVATPRPVPTASRSESRGPTRVQGATMGAVAGAIIGAATGRNVRSAVIGGAAGGILGGMVMGRGTRPAIRGIRP